MYVCIYRANIWALKEAGCTHVIASTACGSLKEEIRPGDLVILDSFIDRTTKRELTFFDGKTPGAPKGVCHMPMDSPYHQGTRQVLMETAKELRIKFHPSGTSVCIEGPRFSTRAESNVFRSYGGATVNMTTVPEVSANAVQMQLYIFLSIYYVDLCNFGFFGF
jgi:5'-methylthioadenosine phosphorylase